MVVAACTALVGVFALLWILAAVFQHGFASFDRDFFTKPPVPPGMKGGGLANAMAGTLIITLLGALAAVPPGILTGVYLSEFAGGGSFASFVRFSVNVLMGMPSLIVGLAVWGTIVVATGTFSAWAGAISLAVIMVPAVAGTTEDMLKLVPDTLRESAVAMGAPRWRVMFVIFLAAKSGIITGILLATARATGETAPLLFTALNSPYWPSTLSAPTANLPVTIFSYAMSPFADWQAKAWGASLVITAAVLALSVGARTILKETKRQ
jgi:phosphate transport system permease protein